MNGKPSAYLVTGNVNAALVHARELGWLAVNASRRLFATQGGNVVRIVSEPLDMLGIDIGLKIVDDGTHSSELDLYFPKSLWPRAGVADL